MNLWYIMHSTNAMYLHIDLIYHTASQTFQIMVAKILDVLPKSVPPARLESTTKVVKVPTQGHAHHVPFRWANTLREMVAVPIIALRSHAANVRLVNGYVIVLEQVRAHARIVQSSRRVTFTMLQVK